MSWRLLGSAAGGGIEAEKREERIPQGSCMGEVRGIEREAETLLLEFGQVDGEMAPPCAVIIPEVVVGVAGAAAG